LWLTAVKLLAVSSAVALMVLLVHPHILFMRLGQFREIAAFLRIFVGVLLGFFLSVSVTRWWSAMRGFMQITDSLKNLQVELNTYGVPEKDCVEVLRLGVMSTWILVINLQAEAQPHQRQASTKRRLLKQFKSGVGMDPTFSTVRKEEIDLLETVHDPTSALWMWLSLQLGRLSEDGLVPQMTTGTFSRLLDISHEAHGGMRIVRTSITCQAPFIYVQMLASLVHLNNIISALSFGMILGGMLGSTLSWAQAPGFKHAEHSSQKQVLLDMQTAGISFTFCVVAPFMYQALLEVAIAIAQPFSSEEAAVPTQRLLKSLERDLHDGCLMAAKIPWAKKKPTFKSSFGTRKS
jgi:predicted membrane chloride channel (bestrophin family)